jgi:predicted HAD superfamily Cof-like phosphohydrolase
MKKYLYCINYLVVDREPIQIHHAWFDNHPDDIQVESYIENIEKNYGSRRVDSNFNYRLVHDATETVPFITEVEEFNSIFGKPNNYTPIIPERKEWEFVYNFILEELEEYKQACERGDIVEVLDALADITYVSLGNGVMLHGLINLIQPAYAEVQASNMSKACKTEQEALETVKIRSIEQGTECHYEKVGDFYIVYRTRDRKVMKSINYFKPNLQKLFEAYDF